MKGSPGATTWAVAVAARWPHPGPAPVVVELDSAGGDLGSRWDLHDEPGLAGLVLSARTTPPSLEPRPSLGPPPGVGVGAGFVQRLPVGVDVVIAPPGDAAAATVAEFASRGPVVLREWAAWRPVFVDVGRLDPHSPMVGYLDVADEVLVVARPVPEELRHLRSRIPALAGRCRLLRLVLIGGGPYRPGEIATYLGVPVAAVVPTDVVGAGILTGRRRPARGWTRRPLLTAARTLALTYHPTTPVPGVVPDVGAAQARSDWLVAGPPPPVEVAR
ncbi:MAG: hypothetical protein HYR62_08490 [Actinobacteria bacterium]|nr:hypothetical protein [Actinomycetota bacterium]